MNPEEKTSNHTMATKAPKYFGPTVGEKMEISRQQLETAIATLAMIFTRSMDEASRASAEKALARIEWLANSWRQHREPEPTEGNGLPE